MNKLNSNNARVWEKLPENIVNGDEYKERAYHEYVSLVQTHLIDKELFKKVHALEYFINMEDWGRGVKFNPKHNVYTPAPTIMPRPKF